MAITSVKMCWLPARFLSVLAYGISVNKIATTFTSSGSIYIIQDHLKKNKHHLTKAISKLFLHSIALVHYFDISWVLWFSNYNCREIGLISFMFNKEAIIFAF